MFNIDDAVKEVIRTAQQAQVAIASAEELIRNINHVVERVDRILTKFEGVLK